MHTRREKTACLAIVIMLLLSEIYLNMVMTDSFFAYKSTGASNTFFQSSSVDFIFGKILIKDDSSHINRYICTTKMLGECVGIELQSAGWNLFLCLLHIGYLFLLQGKFFQLSEIIQTFLPDARCIGHRVHASIRRKKTNHSPNRFQYIK